VFNRALSAEEVAKRFESHANVPDLIGDWTLSSAACGRVEPVAGRGVLSTPLAISPATSTANAPLTLRYPRPAREWVEALPVGNGRLGAMVFGGNVPPERGAGVSVRALAANSAALRAAVGSWSWLDSRFDGVRWRG
jgi:hypothetical protein